MTMELGLSVQCTVDESKYPRGAKISDNKLSKIKIIVSHINWAKSLEIYVFGIESALMIISRQLLLDNFHLVYYRYIIKL